MARKTKESVKPAIGPREVKIDGEVYEIDSVRDLGGGMAELDCGRVEFIVAESRENAGEAARKRWEDMAQDDPEEFRCMVGDECLVKWALGQHAGPGSTRVDSLEKWLDLHLDAPEEEWASYDGTERDVEACGDELAEEIGFVPAVAYRHN